MKVSSYKTRDIVKQRIVDIVLLLLLLVLSKFNWERFKHFIPGILFVELSAYFLIFDSYLSISCDKSHFEIVHILRIFFRKFKVQYSDVIKIVIVDVSYLSARPHMVIYYQKEGREKKYRTSWVMKNYQMQKVVDFLREKNIEIQVDSKILV